MVVQPPLAVVLGQVRGWAECAANRSLSRPAAASRSPRSNWTNTQEATGQSDEARDAPLAQLLGRGWIDREDPPDGRERLDLPYRPTEGDLDGKLVDQLDGHARA